MDAAQHNNKARLAATLKPHLAVGESIPGGAVNAKDSCDATGLEHVEGECDL